MRLGKRWVVRHWVNTYVVQLNPLSRPTPEQMQATADALFVLLREYRSRDRQVEPAIEEIYGALSSHAGRGFRQPSIDGARAAGAPSFEQVSRELEHAARSGRLVLLAEARRDVNVPRTQTFRAEVVAPPIGPEERETFIGVRVVDQDGEPVAGTRVRVELPDGTIRERRTDVNGALLLDGFAQDGPAQITLLDFNEPGDAEPVEAGPTFIEIVLVDEDNRPAAGESFEILLPDGRTQRGKLDARGVARIDQVPRGTCEVSFPDLDESALVSEEA